MVKNLIKITIPGRPISKSNFKLHNINGQAWMPSKENILSILHTKT